MRDLRRLAAWVRGLGDRGASGVEYALVVSLLVVGSVTSIEMMGERVEQSFSETASAIGQSDLSKFDVTTTTCDGCPTPTTAAPTTPTTTTTTTTTTTASPTTTAAPAPAPTAAPAPTTTKAPPTTKAKPDPGTSAGFDDQSRETGKHWRARVELEILDEKGNGYHKARVVVRMTTADGETKDWEFTLGKNGKKKVTWANVDQDEFPVTVTIVSVVDGKNDVTPVDNTFVLKA